MKKLFSILLLIFTLCGCQSHSETIKTKYFQVDIPASWKDLYMYEIYEVDDKVYSLILYDKDSYINSYGGHIATISVYYETDEYDYLPSYEYMGTITNGQERYVIISEFPTDVQFDSTTQQSYKKLCETHQSVLDSIKYINGFKLIVE